MPAAWSYEQSGDLVIELVRLTLGADVVDTAADRIAQIKMTLDGVVPLRRIRVLEVSHEHAGAGIQRVDNHLAIHRTGDLDAAVLQIDRYRRTSPVGFPNGSRL